MSIFNHTHCKFTITSHAAKRLEERSIQDPHTRHLKAANKKTRRVIREACAAHGVKNNWGSKYVYFTSGKSVYVCVQEDVSRYTLITAFNIS